MRNMSYAKTMQQIRDRTKIVTRRLNWGVLKPGDLIRAVDRCMGFKKGEHPVELAILRVKSTRLERLDAITQPECVLEGFPEMTPAEFVAMFCKMNKCQPDRLVRRIEFEYVDQPATMGLKVGIKVNGFHQVKWWIYRLVDAGVARCASCDKPTTSVFWQDQAEFYCFCDSHWEPGEMWTGSTRWRGNFLIKNILPEPFWKWVETLPDEDRVYLATCEFDATDYTKLLPEHYVLEGQKVTLQGGADQNFHVYIKWWQMSDGRYAYEKIRDFGNVCWHDGLEAPFASVQACIDDANRTDKKEPWKRVGKKAEGNA